ncbi:hypothetical protein [Exiguobacterium acetylicum]|uniref:hypothetical protein n=1 Tax=Exiguobacterium acetylicum TaxID=41170 RepID=UPI0034D55016
MSTNNNSASKIREVAKEFLNQHPRVPFNRKEIEEYVDSKITVTPGSKTGALNRLLLVNGPENGIEQLERGVYVYDPSKKNIKQKTQKKSTHEQLIEIMDDAFENAKEVINNTPTINFLSEENFDRLNNYRKLLEIKSDIDALLKDK